MLAVHTGGIDECDELAHQSRDVVRRRSAMHAAERGSADHDTVAPKPPRHVVRLVGMAGHQPLHLQDVLQLQRCLFVSESGPHPVLRDAGVSDLHLLACPKSLGVVVIQRFRHLLFRQRIALERGGPVHRPHSIELAKLIAPIRREYEVERRLPVRFNGDQRPAILDLQSISEFEPFPIHSYFDTLLDRLFGRSTGGIINSYQITGQYLDRLLGRLLGVVWLTGPARRRG